MIVILISVIWGEGSTFQGGSIYQGVGKLEKGFFRGAEGAVKNFCALFWKFLGNLLIKNTIKSDFLGDLGRYLENFEKYPFLGKIHLPTAKSFEIHLPRCRNPSQITVILILVAEILSLVEILTRFGLGV